jgi:hypothetical protein
VSEANRIRRLAVESIVGQVSEALGVPVEHEYDAYQQWHMFYTKNAKAGLRSEFIDTHRTQECAAHIVTMLTPTA